MGDARPRRSGGGISAAGDGPPRVGVFVETSTVAGRDILCGIARYVRESGPWALHLDPRDQIFDPNWMPLWLDGWGGSGLIGRLQSQSLVAAFAAAGVPVVDVLGESSGGGPAGREEAPAAEAIAGVGGGGKAAPRSPTPASPFPLVLPDDAAIGRVAAEHLLDRGFQHFAFIGAGGAAWSRRRQREFCRTVEARGCRCDVIETDAGLFSDESWDRFIEDAAEALRRWPKPIGVMLSSDRLGPQVTQACRRSVAAVPEDVAIVGVTNDEPVCRICDPPLSSVDANYEEVGYRAAALLDRMMSGELSMADARAAPPILVPPRRVVARQSSDISAIGDPVVASALSLIRRSACEGLQVSDIAEQLEVSRSVLQRRFRAVMGRSVHDEIIRVQLHHAQELLRDSTLSLRTVAERAGFNHQEYMGAVFKARLGVTPGEFRRSARAK